MVARRFVSLARMDGVGGMHAQLAWPGLKNQPALASPHGILNAGKAQDVAKEFASGRGVVGINQGMDAGDHQTGRTANRSLTF